MNKEHAMQYKIYESPVIQKRNVELEQIMSSSSPNSIKVKISSTAGEEKWEARAEEHTSELQTHSENSYDVLCLKKKTKTRQESC